MRSKNGKERGAWKLKRATVVKEKTVCDEESLKQHKKKHEKEVTVQEEIATKSANNYPGQSISCQARVPFG